MTIKLQTNSVLQIPISNCKKDFTFIVNNEQFQTNKILADILSPKIAKLHQLDPTISEYFISCHTKGNFQHVLNFLDFNQIPISKSEIPFILEIIEDLCIEKIIICNSDPDPTLDNIFELINKHDNFKFLMQRIFRERLIF